MREDEYEVMKQAGWLLANATTVANFAHMKYLVDLGAGAEFLRMLKPDGEDELMQVATEGLENLLVIGSHEAANDPKNVNPFVAGLVEAGAIDTLRDMSAHSDSTVTCSIEAMLENYFAAHTAIPARTTHDPKEADPKATEGQA
jgi:hypothetical protein